MKSLMEIDGLIDIKIFKGEDGEDDLLLTVNEDLILEKAAKHVANLLLKIQIYKTIGDVERGG